MISIFLHIFVEHPLFLLLLKQAELLGATFTLAVGGPADVHVGTGGGGPSSDLPWREQKNKRQR